MWNKGKITSFLKKGKEIEERFAHTLNNARLATEDEDIHNHFDVIAEVKFDVKGLKKINRSDDQYDENFHYVEILNVNGEKGWLYGDADYFVFELIDYWLLVDKMVLQAYITDNVQKEYTEKPTLNKLYRRSGRKDIITLLKTIDLVYISEQLIKKI